MGSEIHPATVEDAKSSELRTALVPLMHLIAADSPRLDGIDETYAQTLAEMLDNLPPILVQEGTMRVIDGMHRLRAARLNQMRMIEVQFFSGDDEAAFVQAVAANIKHGLPLSRADREAASIRIIQAHSHWSDRAVAKVTGLSDKTIARLRRSAEHHIPRLDSRVGQDGRVRPLNSAHGRELASELIMKKPTASLREIARVAGISPATVRDVRERLERGDDPVTARQRDTGIARSSPVRQQIPARPPETIDHVRILDNLRRDPSLRYTESGRTLLRWLDRRLVAPTEFEDILNAIPSHCLPLIARLARHCVVEWKALTDRLEERSREIA